MFNEDTIEAINHGYAQGRSLREAVQKGQLSEEEAVEQIIAQAQSKAQAQSQAQAQSNAQAHAESDAAQNTTEAKGETSSSESGGGSNGQNHAKARRKTQNNQRATNSEHLLSDAAEAGVVTPYTIKGLSKSKHLESNNKELLEALQQGYNAGLAMRKAVEAGRISEAAAEAALCSPAEKRESNPFKVVK